MIKTNTPTDVVAPTAVALTTGLLSTRLPRYECRKYLAFFAASTPIAAIFSYLLLSFLGFAADGGDWVGLALLFSVRTLSFSQRFYMLMSG